MNCKIGLAVLAAVTSGLYCHAGEAPAAMAAGHPNLPDGHELVAYLNCGVEQECGESNGPRLRQTAGTMVNFESVDGPLGIAVQDAQFFVEGLQEGERYVLGFTFWNVDAPQTRQRVTIRAASAVQTLFAAMQPAAYHRGAPTWTRVLVPLEKLSVGHESSIEIRMEGTVSGQPSVVNEIYLLRQERGERRKRILIVTGDDFEGHLWRETGPEFAEILRADPRLEVSISESPAVLGASFLEHYDAVLLHFKNYSERMPLEESTWTGLDQFVSNGGGLIVAHFGCGAFQEWDGYVRVAGRIWNPAFRAHDPYGAFEVRIAEESHPITEDMVDFTTEDELYTCLDGDTPISILCEATSKVDQKPYPMGFVHHAGEGRVFHCPLGHDVNALQSEGARELYRRAAAWVVGLGPRPSVP